MRNDIVFLSLVFTTTAVLGQLIDGPYQRGPIRDQGQPQSAGPRDRGQIADQLQERAYLQYDNYPNENDFDDGNKDYTDELTTGGDTGGTRTAERLSERNGLLRKGPPLPGVIDFDNSIGFGRGDCKVRTLPHEQYCDIYYYQNSCSSVNTPLLMACPNGLVYTGNGRNGLIGVCDYPHRADCTADNGRSTKELHNPPVSTEHCDWLYGIFGHETSCTRYWTCWNGTSTEQFCIGGLLYNEESHSCDWPQNVGGCQKHPLCKDDPNGNVPLGKSCNRYWACQGGYPRLQRCPAMLVFDKKRKRCIAPPTEDCDIPPTPPPTEEKEGDQNQQGERFAGQEDPGNRRRLQTQPNPRRDNSRPSLPLPPDFQLPEGALPLNLN